ncbi:flagellar hook capping protein, partial [candidate division KSB1 bacterium]
SENSAVKIFSASGELVRSFAREQVPGAQVIWDGRDNDGKLVPSGVYFFMAYIEETGVSKAGKVAVIRR